MTIKFFYEKIPTKKQGTEGMNLSVRSTIYDNPVVITLRGGKPETIPSNTRRGHLHSLSPLRFDLSLNDILLPIAIKQREKIKRIQMRKKEVKFSDSASDAVLYLRNSG